MASNDETISITVSHRGTSHPFSLSPDTTLHSLQVQLEELTSVPVSLQKLLFKGKKVFGDGNQEVTLKQSGLKNGGKVQMLGSTNAEVQSLHSTENAQRRREQILRERALKPQAKVRSTGPSGSMINTLGSTPSLTYTFHKLIPLPHLPNPPAALEILQKLSDDLAIKHVMAQHKFSVGILTELAPHEHPQLLGLNVNAGETIKLRIRTNAYDGFRSYNEIRRVLCHELAHNVWGDHDENFKTLDSRLNRGVAEFERARKGGTHRFVEDFGEVYEPSAEVEAEARAQVLGGASAAATVDNSPEERRRRILEAASKRVQKEDQEIDHGCGDDK